MPVGPFVALRSSLHAVHAAHESTVVLEALLTDQQPVIALGETVCPASELEQRQQASSARPTGHLEERRLEHQTAPAASAPSST